MKLLIATFLTLSPLMTLANSAEMRIRYLYKEQYRNSVTQGIQLAEDRLALEEEKIETLCNSNPNCEQTPKYAELVSEVEKLEKFIDQTKTVLAGLR